MATLNQIAYDILNTIRGGRSSNTEHLSVRQIKFRVNQLRALLIRRTLERNLDFPSFEQELPALTISDISETNLNESLPTEAFGTLHSNGLKLLRSDTTIPTTIRLASHSGITSITVPNYIGSIPIIEYERVPFIVYERYTAKKKKAFIFGDYVYIIMSTTDKIRQNQSFIDVSSFEPEFKAVEETSPTSLIVKGIFENPSDIAGFTDESEYPCTSDIIAQIISQLVKEFSIATSSFNDQVLDTNQDIPR